MADARDVRRQVEQLIERAQADIVDASHQLAEGITKETDRFVPPISKDLERLLDDVFDFTERVVKGQRKMMSEVVKSINEQSRRAAEVGRKATSRTSKRAPATKRSAKRAPAKKPAAKRAPVKKA